MPPAQNHFQGRKRKPLGGLILLILAFAAGAYLVFTRVEKVESQVAGVCDETGERLSDADILILSKTYALSQAQAHGADNPSPDDVLVRIVPEVSLRAEDQVPPWVRSAGGFRAYVEIFFDERLISETKAQGLMTSGIRVVSNCGKIRVAIYEFRKGWL